MKIFEYKKELSDDIKSLKNKGETIGLVPTMGALHEGHQTLVEKALAENDQVVVSIFVNPTQFNNKEDLKNYPRPLERDIRFLKSIERNRILVFTPNPEDIYDGDVSSENFDFEGLEQEMEGAHRPGHFDGVGSIVKRLLLTVQPDRAYFGEKDFQQLAIIRKLTEKHRIDTEIVGCAIHRAENGLAMSSRNERLKPQFRKAAPFIYKTLTSAKLKFGTKSANNVTEWVKKQFEKHPILQLEYFTIADEKTLKPIKRKSPENNRDKIKYRAFIAVYADDIRLIDNIALN